MVTRRPILRIIREKKCVLATKICGMIHAYAFSLHMCCIDNGYCVKIFFSWIPFSLNKSLWLSMYLYVIIIKITLRHNLDFFFNWKGLGVSYIFQLSFYLNNTGNGAIIFGCIIVRYVISLRISKICKEYVLSMKFKRNLICTYVSSSRYVCKCIMIECLGPKLRNGKNSIGTYQNLSRR